ncbi:tachylectin-related carbohydrate-binding protein [Micromonospora sp. NPDC051300]|uniref:tachylectin-related carbohydrate-binding protein n=1 Tax=Micromonospora sp. NPDC051300 TaxID=3364286 RepID=UPI00378E0E76
MPFVYNTTAGLLYQRDLRNPFTGSTTWGGQTTIGTSGWTAGRMLGGPDGRVYTISSAGLNRYRRVGTSWELVDGKQNWLISSSFTGYATAAFRDKITVDEAGDFYLIDNAGKLRWYRFDEPTRKWVISGRVIDSGWEKYNLVVATSPGVLYARLASGGTLHRYRFDPSTERWLMRDKLVGSSGFASFTKGLFTAGGDSLFGVQATGNVIQYRYDEDAGGWPVQSQSVGTMNYPNVFTFTNICHQGALTAPVRPSTPTQQYSPIAVLQAPPASGAAVGTVEYAYVDNIGRTIHGRQTDPDAYSSIQWTPVESVESSTGKPSLTTDKDGKLRLFTHQTSSDVRVLTQTALGAPAWKPWAGLAGGMLSEPVGVRLADDTLVVFALDAGGALWARTQDKVDGADGDLLGWTKLGGTGLAGNPAVTVGTDGSATVTAVDGTGAVVTATYKDRALTTPFTSIGGTGFTGTPAVVVMPGRRAMVFARNGDGTIKRQYQNVDGTWSGTWDTVGSGTVTAAGNPSAILDPNLGRILVVTRTSDNTLVNSWETGQGTGVWGDWISPDGLATYPTDPTAFSLQNSSGTSLAYVSRNLNGSVIVFVAQGLTSAARRTTATAPRFAQVTIPQPR